MAAKISTLAVALLTLLFSAFIGGCVTTTAPQAKVSAVQTFSPKVYDRLAVIVFDETKQVRQKGTLRQVEDVFMQAALEKGYTLAARSDVDKLIQELRFQNSAISENHAAKIGRLLNVRAVILVSINDISAKEYKPLVYVKGKRYYMATANISARFVEVSRGEVVWLSSHTGRSSVDGTNRNEMTRVLPLVARVVARELPTRLPVQ